LRALGTSAEPKRALSHQQDLIRLLREVGESGTGRAAALDSTVMGKTGTSQDYRDAWFVGSNRSLVVGVWVGNDDRTPMKNVTGGTWPAQIWKGFVSAATPLLDRMDNKGVAEAASASAAGSKLDQCDHQACAAAYNSFRASDCTYQSYAGARRRCEKGLSREERVAGSEMGFNAPASGEADVSTLDPTASPRRRAQGATPAGNLGLSASVPSDQQRRNRATPFGAAVFQSFGN
jgi:membrane peptidoglycan carboxypeptidase